MQFGYCPVHRIGFYCLEGRYISILYVSFRGSPVLIASAATRYIRIQQQIKSKRQIISLHLRFLFIPIGLDV